MLWLGAVRRVNAMIDHMQRESLVAHIAFPHWFRVQTTIKFVGWDFHDAHTLTVTALAAMSLAGSSAVERITASGFASLGSLIIGDGV